VDHLDLVLSMDVRKGIIRRGAVVATSPERKRPLTLLFGGPFDDPVLDRSSQLTALWELPFSRLGRALGWVAPEQARDPAAIHAHQRSLLLAARCDAERAWSRAHADRGP
jgi:hypothetical protein